MCTCCIIQHIDTVTAFNLYNCIHKIHVHVAALYNRQCDVTELLLCIIYLSLIVGLFLHLIGKLYNSHVCLFLCVCVCVCVHTCGASSYCKFLQLACVKD